MNYFKLSMLISNNEKVSKSWLLKNIDNELFESSVENGYLEVAGYTTDGEVQYRLTDKGKKLW